MIISGIELDSYGASMIQAKKTLPARSPCGRKLSAMPLQGGTLSGGGWFPAIDLYELDANLLVYMDVSGVDPGKLQVEVSESLLTVSGERRHRLPEKLSCVHQLEIECGVFERSINLPKPVDVSQVVSECANGFLSITLPLRRNRGKIRVAVL